MKNTLKKALFITLVGVLLPFITNAGVKMADKYKYVAMETDKGVIEMKLYPEKTPKHVANFLKLVDEGFYTGIPFHRVVPDFVAQAGDGTLVGRERPDYGLPLEIDPDLRHNRGAIGAARTQVRDSASTQFYFVLKAAHFLDNEYTVFGDVVKGMDIVDGINQGDEIIKAYRLEKPTTADVPSEE